jgi:hypothetical protein
MPRKRIWLFLLPLLLASCTPSETAIQTAIAQTQSAPGTLLGTDTPYPYPPDAPTELPPTPTITKTPYYPAAQTGNNPHIENTNGPSGWPIPMVLLMLAIFTAINEKYSDGDKHT